jgi:hypothetical protein
MKKFFIFILILAIGVGIGYVWTRYANRPCVLQERKIMDYYGFTGESEQKAMDFVQRLQLAKMYVELANNGCPEHAKDYEKKAEVAVETLSIGGMVGINSEIKIDMNKVANVVNAATEKAVEAVGTFLDKVKDKKVSITVE